MDINDLRSIVTVVSMVAFLGIVAWAWSRTNHHRFDEAAQLPFEDDSNNAQAARGETK